MLSDVHPGAIGYLEVGYGRGNQVAGIIITS
jgi:hypothetical protein